jgi:hypothetical protein
VPCQKQCDLPDIPQPFVQHGNSRQASLFEDGDSRRDLDSLGEAALKRGSAVHACVSNVPEQSRPSVGNAGQGQADPLDAAVAWRTRRELGQAAPAQDWQLMGETLQGPRDRLGGSYRRIEMNSAGDRKVRAAAMHPCSGRLCNAHASADALPRAHPSYLLHGTSDQQRRRYRELFDQCATDEAVHGSQGRLSAAMPIGHAITRTPAQSDGLPASAHPTA